MNGAADLRARAEGLAAPLPALLAGAEQLAAQVAGLHGRRRAGPGETFWQYRPAQPHDGARSIDWRRSARGDQLYARDLEWQVSQAVDLWVDPDARMDFGPDGTTKGQRAAELALALAIGLLRGGERVGLVGGPAPRSGDAQLMRLAGGLISGGRPADPGAGQVTAHGRVAFFSDFLGDPAPVEAAMGAAADRGVRGVLCQILTAEEAEFPYRGRTVFEDMSGAPQFETLRADGLRDRYLTRLADRQARLEKACAATGWQMMTHRTDAPAAEALLWLHQALGAQR